MCVAHDYSTHGEVVDHLLDLLWVERPVGVVENGGAYMGTEGGRRHTCRLDAARVEEDHEGAVHVLGYLGRGSPAPPPRSDEIEGLVACAHAFQLEVDHPVEIGSLGSLPLRQPPLLPPFVRSPPPSMCLLCRHSTIRARCAP